MNTFSLHPADVPSTLYRVQYEDSMTTYDVYEGLEADDTVTLYDGEWDENEDDTLQEFGDAVEQHLNWDRGYRSIFFSLFSQRRHAENWMLERHTLLAAETALSFRSIRPLFTAFLSSAPRRLLMHIRC